MLAYLRPTDSIIDVPYHHSGSFTFVLEGSTLPSGTYFCRFWAVESTASCKLVLLK